MRVETILLHNLTNKVDVSRVVDVQARNRRQSQLPRSMAGCRMDAPKLVICAHGTIQTRRARKSKEKKERWSQFLSENLTDGPRRVYLVPALAF